MRFHNRDLKMMSWQEFETQVRTISKRLNVFLTSKDLHIDIVVPILRGGGILGVRLAHEFDVLHMAPYQFKYVLKDRYRLQKIFVPTFSEIHYLHKKNPTVLVVEGNHSTGATAQQVILDIRRQLPKAKILYVALTMDYYYKDVIKDVTFSACGIYTNENRKLDIKTCDTLGISFGLVYLFPWESAKEELAMLNNTPFDYRGRKNV